MPGFTPVTAPPGPAELAPHDVTLLDGAVTDDRENVVVDDELPTGPETHDEPVDLGRIAWFVTALVCFVAAVIVLLRRDYGYAGVAFAVAIAAAINLV